MRFFRFLFCLFSFFFALFPAVVFGQSDSGGSGMDGRCFNLDQCVAARQRIIDRYTAGGVPSQERPEDGFYVGSDARAVCGETLKTDGSGTEPLGFCAPIGSAVTSVNVAGKNSFNNIADFIKYVYRYGIVIGIILATVMVIVAGIQWLTSAGGSDGIGSAKKKITGSVIGLALLATSYVILQTINPALVQLRLPQVWLISAMDLAPTSCSVLAGNTKIAEALSPLPAGRPARTADERSEQIGARFSSIKGTDYNKTRDQAVCGGEYFVQGAGNATCRGSVCPVAEVCLDKKDGTAAGCIRGSVALSIFSSDAAVTAGSDYVTRMTVGRLLGVDEGWTWPWVTGRGQIELHAVCVNRNESNERYITEVPVSISSFSSDEEVYRQYAVIEKTGNPDCGGEDNIIGYVVGLDLNEFGAGSEFHLIGIEGNRGVDLGDKEFGWDGDVSGPRWSCLLNNDVVRNKFISKRQMEEGIMVDVDVSRVMDIDGSHLASFVGQAGGGAAVGAASCGAPCAAIGETLGVIHALSGILEPSPADVMRITAYEDLGGPGVYQACILQTIK